MPRRLARGEWQGSIGFALVVLAGLIVFVFILFVARPDLGGVIDSLQDALGTILAPA